MPATSKIANARALPGAVVLLAIAAFLILNAAISKMTVSGLVVNTIAAAFLATLILIPNPALLISFFFLNFLFGPFLFVNLDQVGMPSIGRLDFLVATLFLVTYVARLQFRYTTALLLAILVLSVSWVAYTDIANTASTLVAIDNYYTLFGRVACGLILFALFREEALYTHRRVLATVCYATLTLHIILSVIQFKIPITIRAGTIEAGFSIGGIAINRPVGLFEASYVYGVTTIGAWYIAWTVAGEHLKRYGKALLVIALPICVISTRSVALGCVVFLVSLAWQKALVLRILVLLTCFGSIAAIAAQGVEVANLLDQSNSTKVLLAWTIATKWIESFPSLQFFVGHGYDQAAMVAAESSFFQLAEAVGAAYDNNVDKGLGFPIHNVYLQILFEYGLIAFIPTVALIRAGAVNVVSGRIQPATGFFWCVAVTHYLVHNGLFAPLLVAALLIAAYPSIRGKNQP